MLGATKQLLSICDCPFLMFANISLLYSSSNSAQSCANVGFLWSKCFLPVPSLLAQVQTIM